MKDVLKNLKSFTRLVFIIGVMTGLFFSGGEGIQLLPFPAASAEAEKDVFQIQIGKSKTYAFSVYNPNSHIGIVKSKVQKDAKYLDYADVAKNGFQTVKFFYSSATKNYQQAAFSKSSDIFISPSDRAPPVA